MRFKFLKTTLIIAITAFSSVGLYAQQVVKLSPEEGDMTPKLRELLESVNSDGIRIELEAGTYYFKPDYAFEKYCALTNHGNGSKKILFPINNYNKVEIEGNGAKIICHGQMMPFLFEECDNVTVSNLSINWDIPFTFLAEVVAVDPNGEWREVKPRREGFSWALKNGEIQFPNIDGFNYAYLGSTLEFTKDTKRVAPQAVDMHSEPTRVEELENGNLKIYEKLRVMPRVGTLLSSKGDRAQDRYAPAFDFKSCNNIRLQGVTVHHALGMAYLFEKSKDISIINSNVKLEEGSNRVISSTADATHFANCAGDILIDGCTFQNMLDDGTNVHGTYVEVDEVLNATSVRVAFKHFEQMGFSFTELKDEMWFVLHPSPSRLSETGVVKSVKVVNEKYTVIEFEEPLPAGMKKGDILENKTWNPTFTMRNCTINNHRARNVVLKTPLKTVIENNNFSSMMSAILFRGETYFWFESGAVQDVLIKGNKFINCADCGTEHAVLYVTPRLGESFNQTEQYDRNIRFVDNYIDSYNHKVVWADRVDGLLIEGNTIIRNTQGVPVFKDDPIFQLENCKNVVIKDNSYKGKETDNVLKADTVSMENLKMKKLKFD